MEPMGTIYEVVTEDELEHVGARPRWGFVLCAGGVGGVVGILVSWAGLGLPPSQLGRGLLVIGVAAVVVGALRIALSARGEARR